MSIAGVVLRRRAERDRLVGVAREFVRRLDSALAVRAAVIIGSVARGDFNVWSDIDLLIVADDLPAGYLERLERLGARPPRVQPILWTPDEWAGALRRGNPMAREALEAGVWIHGSADHIIRRESP